jgi:hypothetical protein
LGNENEKWYVKETCIRASVNLRIKEKKIGSFVRWTHQQLVLKSGAGVLKKYYRDACRDKLCRDK